MAKNKLTFKQQRFVTEYIKHGNGQKAAEAAGYAKNSARIRAATLLTNSNVKAQLDKVREKETNKAILTHAQCCEKLSEIAVSTPDGHATAIKAIAELSKLRGYYKPEKHEIKGENTLRIEFV